MRRPSMTGLLALALAACAGPISSPSASPLASAVPHSHDPIAESVKADLAEAFGMAFEAAGPHHEIGRAPDGVELDLVGIPVEEVVLSLPTADLAAGMAAGRDYLPYLRKLLGGPASAWERMANMLDCLETPNAACDTTLTRGHLSARITDGGEGYLVLVISLEP